MEISRVVPVKIIYQEQEDRNMSGRYFNGADFEAAPIMSKGCKDLPGGYVNDTIGMGCWAVTGQTVNIGDTDFSVHKGMECCNFNFRVCSTQSPCPCKDNLPGARA